MRYISKALVASGLVILTGPLCFMAQAQDYVDVERNGEAANNAAPAPTTTTPATTSIPARLTPMERQASDPYGAPASDPYSVQPAQPYPATSYGLNNAPAGAAVAAPITAVSCGRAEPEPVANLFLQVQQLQQEVMRLNGMVEEQAMNCAKLKSQSLERYVDLDKRLSAGRWRRRAMAGELQVAVQPAQCRLVGGFRASGRGVAEQAG